ncbi:hypothetical protein ACH5RR_012168 [Cinchona calisaya]|uniref:14-3-3 domain-containing protein n=1 Tax=Cinchona calisaya TaxID=153742 RepID=A0ABD3A9K1_9GENT
MDISKTLTREQYLYMAKLAELSERYEDVTNNMNNLVTLYVSPTSALTEVERKLLLTGNKNVVDQLRSAWRTVSLVEQNKEGRKNGDPEERVRKYRHKLEGEISKVCDGILKLLNETLIPSAGSSIESKVFYYTIRGDYERYLAEINVGDDECSEKATLSYKAAQTIALADLRPSHPLRLSLALNFSVHFYEILKATQTACSMARVAFDDALEDMNSSPGEPSMESLHIMQLLRYNVTASSWLNDLRDQVEHNRVLNVIYRSATALGTRLPSIANAKARVAVAGALLRPVSSSTKVVMKRAQDVAQAVVKSRSSLP